MPRLFVPATLGFTRRAGILLMATATGCAAGSRERDGGNPTEAFLSGVSPGTSGLLRPDQIDAILRESPRTYRVSATAPVEAASLPDVVPRGTLERARRMDPFLEVRRDRGKLELRSHLPDPVVEPLFAEASQAFEEQDYETARRLYVKAIRVRPDYFKSYTYLGNALYFLGRYIEAKQAFEYALTLNAFDYQAHLFLGDTLHQLGHYGRAKASLVQAYMLNRENEVVQERLHSTLAKLDLAVRARRLSPQVRVEPDQGDGVVIRLDRSRGARWYALAACMACWTYEDRCRRRAEPSSDPLQLGMYRECLLNQAASIAVRRRGNESLPLDERALLAAIENGYLEAIIFWEVVAPRAPAVMVLLPESLRENIFEYIEQYVFVSTQVVRAPVQALPEATHVAAAGAPGNWQNEIQLAAQSFERGESSGAERSNRASARPVSTSLTFGGAKTTLPQ